MYSDGEERIIWLTRIFSELLKCEESTAKELILSTDIGKQILKNNECLLYEQETANTYEILTELDYLKTKNITTNDITMVCKFIYKKYYSNTDH